MDFEEMQNDLAEVEQDWKCPIFTWNGGTYTCIPNTIADSVKNNSEWFNSNADFTMTVRMNQFIDGLFPQKNDEVVFNGYALNIKNIKRAPQDIFWDLVCSLPTINN